MNKKTKAADRAMRRKRRSKTVRVIAAEQPPDYEISENDLEELDPYITDAELADWLKDFQERQAAGSLEQYDEDAIFMSAILGDLQHEIYEGIYEATKDNPLYAMEAFVTAHHLGLYPPRWVLDWLHDAFSTYLASPEEEDLAKLLKAKRGKGKTPIKKEAQKLQVETNAMNHILALNVQGISIEKAAGLVEEQYRNRGIEIQSAEVLAERFSKRGWSAIVRSLRKHKLNTMTENINLKSASKS